ncbi:hypothetical protein HG530_005117 [Fusarium avenaceum]|nr:hypothetical protein HG530_005117 [Fusarium avenaceum]
MLFSKPGCFIFILLRPLLQQFLICNVKRVLKTLPAHAAQLVLIGHLKLEVINIFIDGRETNVTVICQCLVRKNDLKDAATRKYSRNIPGGLEATVGLVVVYCHDFDAAHIVIIVFELPRGETSVAPVEKVAGRIEPKALDLASI